MRQKGEYARLASSHRAGVLTTGTLSTQPSKRVRAAHTHALAGEPLAHLAQSLSQVRGMHILVLV